MRGSATSIVGLCLTGAVVALLSLTALPLLDELRPLPPRRPSDPEPALSTPPPPPKFPSAAGRDDTREREPSAEVADMRAAALYHLFDHNDRVLGNEVAYCVGVVSAEGERSRDPSPPFMRRFRLHFPRVVPESHCRAEGTRRAVEISTGRNALFFTLGPVKRTGPETAEIEAEHWRNGLGAALYVVYLDLRGGRWVVDRLEVTGIA